MKLGLVKSLKLGVVTLLFATHMSLSGCVILYKTVGDILIPFAETQTVPELLASDDLASACAIGEAFQPFMSSFGRITTPPDELNILLYYMGSGCTEEKAWEQDLRYLRAIKMGNVAEAQDARILQKRYLGATASRRYKSYQKLVTVFGEPGGTTCPKFSNRDEEFVYLIGLLAGVQAVINDVASGGIAGVPQGIAPMIGRSAGCLDSDVWWGAPGALQAAVWTMLPTSKPNDQIDTGKLLQFSVEIGLRQGVRLVQILEAVVYQGEGDTEGVKRVIRRFAHVSKTVPGNPKAALINAIARANLTAMSDSLWTEATGKRTPVGGLGTFWDDRKKEKIIDIDDLL